MVIFFSANKISIFFHMVILLFKLKTQYIVC
uniref:Uncharacterized protein n=1 Tax=Siphoviridae sp. ctC6Q17 TaxID=2827271 RepID=A0A8S5R3I6_9CAUD|nr:MAG TPA: hypothetical protein [Siphoviridae sp. ctC6Q17]